MPFCVQPRSARHLLELHRMIEKAIAFTFSSRVVLPVSTELFLPITSLQLKFSSFLPKRIGFFPSLIRGFFPVKEENSIIAFVLKCFAHHSEDKEIPLFGAPCTLLVVCWFRTATCICLMKIKTGRQGNI